MLTALEKDVTALREEFAASVADPEFLRALKNRHDVYITYDHRQKSREEEATAIKEAGVTALWLGPFWGKKTFWQQAKWLVNRWEKIEDFVGSTVPGTCAVIRENGRAMPFQL